MRIEHRRNIGRENRDGVADADAAFLQRRCQAPTARVEVAIGDALVAMDDRDRVGKDRGGPLKKGQRRQRLVVRRILVEMKCIRVAGLGGARRLCALCGRGATFCGGLDRLRFFGAGAISSLSACLFGTGHRRSPDLGEFFL